jgi:hypothetical protein
MMIWNADFEIPEGSGIICGRSVARLTSRRIALKMQNINQYLIITRQYLELIRDKKNHWNRLAFDFFNRSRYILNANKLLYEKLELLHNRKS